MKVSIPDIGDFESVEIIELLVSEGSTVQAEEPLLTLESDKATMEVPCPADGVVTVLHCAVGDRVSQGSLVLELETGQPGKGESKLEMRPPPAEPTIPRPAKPASTPPPPERMERTDSIPHASPGVRRFARELGANLHHIQGSGPKGRILKEDVKTWIKQQLDSKTADSGPASAGIPPVPEVDFTQFGETELLPLSRIKKLSGPHLTRAWLNIPHVTHHDEADITDLETFRQSLREEAEEAGLRITILSFVMKALVAALKRHPVFNASLAPDGAGLILKKYYNVGIAVDTPNGLVVPVIRDVNRKSIFDLARELADTSKRARDGTLKTQDIQGGCISISSLGGIGGTGFTPIINAPEVAILGISKARFSPVWDGTQFSPRLLMPIDLSYDHRVIDGAQAARFCVDLARSFEDVRRLAL